MSRNYFWLCRIKALLGHMVFVMLLLMSLIRNVFSHPHIAQCVHWYLVYSLSLYNLDELMAERGIVVDHLTLHRWVICLPW